MKSGPLFLAAKAVGRRILRLTVVVWVTPPPVPVTVMVEVPVRALLATVTVIVDVPEPGAGIDLGLKVTVTGDGTPLAERLIAESKPPEIAVVIVELAELPLLTEIEEGDALMVKLGFVPVTVNDTVVNAVVLPEVPVTVIPYFPGSVDEATVIVIVEVPAPVIDDGLKLTVTPEGWPLADREMTPSKPPVTVLVIRELPALPWATVTEVGEAERLKPGPEFPAS